MNTQLQDPREIGINGLSGLPTLQASNPFRNHAIDYNDLRVRQQYRDFIEQSNIVLNGPMPINLPDDFGNSRYDENVKGLSELNNLNEFRANEQSGLAKIGAGIVKGTILAGTTFLDGIGGTIAGALNIAYGVANDTVNSGKEALNAFVQNPFSQTMQQINEWSESALPNYYTYTEQTGPWYSNIFTANFLGDKVLKNLGFMIGAAYAGKVNAGAVSKIMGTAKVRQAFKGAVAAAAEGTSFNAADDVLKAYQSGQLKMSSQQIVDELASSAKKLKQHELTLKTIGSVSAAMGEARIEAISNSTQFLSNTGKRLDTDYEMRMKTLEYTLQSEHPEWFSLVQDPDQLSWKMKLTSPEGFAELERRKAKLTEEYEIAKANLKKEATDMANEIFVAETITLSANNFLSIGRFFTGGYTAGRNYTNLISKQADGTFAKNKLPIHIKRAEALMSPVLEGNEEMMQSFIAETSTLKHMADINSFYGHKVNPEATSEMIDWYNASREGFSNTYGNFDRWEEFFIGLVTAPLGAPKFGLKTKENGKKGISLEMSGELWEGMREAQQMTADQEQFINRLNEIITKPEFKTKFESLIRDTAIKKKKELSLHNGDALEYKNAELEEIANIAIMFDQAGALQELYDQIDEYSTDINADEIRQQGVNKDLKTSVFDGMTDEQVVDFVRHEAQDMRKKIDQYVEISKNLRTLYGADISTDTVSELAVTMLQLNDTEDRFFKLFNEVKADLEQNIKGRNSRYFGAQASNKVHIDLRDITPEDLLKNFTKKEVIDILNSNLEWLKAHGQDVAGVAQQQEKVSDLLRLFKQRLAFINKYNTLSKHPELFTEANKKLEEEIHQQYLDKVDDTFIEGLKDVTTIDEFRKKIANLKPETVTRLLDKLSNGSNTELKALAKQYQDYDVNVNNLLSNVNDSKISLNTKRLISNAINNNPNDYKAIIKELTDISKDPNTDPKIKEEIETVLSLLQHSENVSPKQRTRPARNNKKPTTTQAETEDDTEPSEEEKSTPNFASMKGLQADGEIDAKTNINEDETLDDALEDCKTEEEVEQTLESFNVPSKEKQKLKKTISKKINSVAPLTVDQAKEAVVEQEKKKNTQNPLQKLRSWIVTQFNIEDLKSSKDIKTYIPTDDDLKKVQQVLIETGAYEFVDSGQLGDRFQENNDIPIYLVKAPTTTVPAYYTFLAVPKDSNQAISDDNIQIVGVIGSNPKDNSNSLQTLLAFIKDKTSTEKDKWTFVTNNGDKVFTKISHIYSGRMLTQPTTQTLTMDFIQNGVSALGLQLESGWRTTLNMNKNTVTSLNINNPQSRNGSMWLLVKGADGIYYPKYVEIKHSQEWYNDVKTDTDNAILNKLKSAIQDLLNDNNYTQLAGKFTIKSIFHFANNQDIIFTEDGKILIKQGDNREWQKSIDEVTVDEILAMIVDMDLRMQVDSQDIQHSNTVKELVESKLFKTDVQLHNGKPGNVNASFDIMSLDENGTPIETDHPKTEHTGQKGINRQKSEITFTLTTLKGKFKPSRDHEGNWVVKGKHVSAEITNLLNELEEFYNSKNQGKKIGDKYFVKTSNKGAIKEVTKEEFAELQKAAKKKQQQQIQEISVEAMIATLREEEGASLQGNAQGATLQKPKSQKKSPVAKVVTEEHKEKVTQQKENPKVIEAQPAPKPAFSGNTAADRRKRALAAKAGKAPQQLSIAEMNKWLSTNNYESAEWILQKMKESNMDTSVITSIESLQQQIQILEKCRGISAQLPF